MATIDEPITVTVDPAVDSAETMLRNVAHQFLQAGRSDELSWICAHDFAPEDLLLELCDLGLCFMELGHRSGPRKLLERMADEHHYPEAIITLASKLYLDPDESTDSFAMHLGQHAESGWMFESLVRLEPTSAEKAKVFLSAIRSHPEAVRLLHLAEVRRFESAAAVATDSAEIECLFATNEPRVWRVLASNRSVPCHLLEQLASVTGIRNAADIRDRARRTLTMQ
jgi:hypothetical protein